MPIIMVQLHAKSGGKDSMGFTQLLLFLFMNAATLYVFAAKPFMWPNGEVARFMW